MKLALEFMNDISDIIECPYPLMNWDLSHGTFAMQGMELKQLLLLTPGYGAICPVN